MRFYKNISFGTQVCVCAILMIALLFLGRLLNSPNIELYGELLCGISFVVHPAIPEKFPEKYHGKTGESIVRIGGIVIVAIVIVALLMR